VSLATHMASTKGTSRKISEAGNQWWQSQFHGLMGTSSTGLNGGKHGGLVRGLCRCRASFKQLRRMFHSIFQVLVSVIFSVTFSTPYGNLLPKSKQKLDPDFRTRPLVVLLGTISC
jgi:hypothetical protein